MNSIYGYHRRSQDFSKWGGGGGVTLCQSEGTRLFGHFQAETTLHFRHLFLGCLVKKGLQKEGSGAPQDPPATPMGMCKKNHIFFFFYA